MKLNAKIITREIFKKYYEKILVHEFTIDEERKYRIDIAGYDKNNKKLYGYEIKTNKYDLLNDEKMFNYQNYFNYIYLIVPISLLDIAKEKVKNSNYGIIVISENKLKNNKVKYNIKVEKRSRLNKYSICEYYNYIEKINENIIFKYKNLICQYSTFNIN